MISLKVLSTAAVMALLLPVAASHAQNAMGKGAAAGGVRMGGTGGVARFSGGGGAPPVARFGGGGAPAMHFNPGGGGPPVARFSGGGPPVANFGGGGYRHRHGGGFVPGLAAGAIIGGVIASPGYGYYGGPVYYDDQYYDSGVVAVAPVPADDDAVAYCMQTYMSYDPQSGTYLGYDGLRHPCP